MTARCARGDSAATNRSCKVGLHAATVQACRAALPLILVVLLLGCGDAGERPGTLFPAPIVWKDPRLDLTRWPTGTSVWN